MKNKSFEELLNEEHKIQEKEIKKVLVTGGLGGLGRHVSGLLLDSGYKTIIFDVKTKENEKTAKKFQLDKCNIKWGDITNPQTYKNILPDVDAVIHLAFIIPPKSEEPWAREINVDGTKNLVEKLEKLNPDCRFIFSSSVSVYGITNEETPPLTTNHPVNPTDNYTSDKIKCEKFIQTSKLNWVILRFSEALHLNIELKMSTLKQMYNVAWYNRIEFIHPKDIATACKNSLTADCVGKIYNIAGGARCQTTFYDQMTQTFKMLKLPPPKKEKFNEKPYYLDWYETTNSQKKLNYQNHTFDDYLKDLKEELGWKLKVIRFFSPIIKHFI